MKDVAPSKLVVEGAGQTTSIADDPKHGEEPMQMKSLFARGNKLSCKKSHHFVAMLIAGISLLTVLTGDVTAQCIADAQLSDAETSLNNTLAQLAATDQAQHPAEYRKLQEQALQRLEQVQCAREAAAPAEAVKRGPSLKTPFAIVPVLFITDRKLLEVPEGEHKYFGGERTESGVNYGRILVRMPAESYAVNSPRSFGVRMVTEKDSHAGITVAAPENLSSKEFLKIIHGYKSSLPKGELARAVVFIHGYNNTYTDAVQAAARLSFGLSANILPVAISWPSQGSFLKYWNDEENVEASVERLRPELRMLLANQDIDEVILVAHSMGSRLAARVLSQLHLQSAGIPNAGIPKLTRVALAAADLYEPEIKGLWPRIGNLPSKGWIFYTSANDLALLASSIVHASPPIGDSRNRVFTIPTVETIDASAVAPKLKGYGHSYVIDNPLLRVDLRRWMVNGLAAAGRGLKKGNSSQLEFWVITN